jgi:rhodanese-related sulfurtransferase
MTMINNKNRGTNNGWRTSLWQKRLLAILGPIVMACLFAPVTLGSELSDAKKKEVVYRQYAEYKREFPEVKDIAPQRAMALLDEGRIVFVDTREAAEMAVSILPSAISKEHFMGHHQDYSDKIVVAYCTIGKRSGDFVREMAQQGITMLNLKGSILAWTLEGGKVYDQSGNIVNRVHVYGDEWDYAPAGYETVKFNFVEKLL